MWPCSDRDFMGDCPGYSALLPCGVLQGEHGHAGDAIDHALTCRLFKSMKGPLSSALGGCSQGDLKVQVGSKC